MAHVVTDSAGNVLSQTNPDTTPRGYGPADPRSAYIITTTGRSGTTIAIVDAYGHTNAESDLHVHRSRYGLPTCTTANGCFQKLNQKGAYGSNPYAFAGASALNDVERQQRHMRRRSGVLLQRRSRL